MANEWVRMRSGLFFNHKVIAIGHYLENDREFINWWLRGTQKGVKENVTEIVTPDVMRFVTIAALLRVWSSANENTSDGFFSGVGLLGISDIAGLPSFGEAMASVGWAIEEEDPLGVRLPDFLTYNTPSEKRVPKSDAQRAREYRGRKRVRDQNSHDDAARHETSQSVTKNHAREEKRREEKNKPVGEGVESHRSDPAKQFESHTGTGARARGEAGPGRTAAGPASDTAIDLLALDLVQAFGWNADTCTRQRRAIKSQAAEILTHIPAQAESAVELAREKANAKPRLDKPVAAWWAALTKKYPALGRSKRSA